MQRLNFQSLRTINAEAFACCKKLVQPSEVVSELLMAERANVTKAATQAAIVAVGAEYEKLMELHNQMQAILKRLPEKQEFTFQKNKCFQSISRPKTCWRQKPFILRPF